MNRYSIWSAVVMCSLLSLFCRAQGTAFTYQGRLNNNGAPATGVFDLVFTVYDLPTGTGAFANQTNSATPVTNGLFTVTLNFGAGIFTGPDRWLEIAARTSGSGSLTTLSPRQRITATPYAITAGNISGSVAASQLSGSIASANIAAGTITSTMLAAGSVTASNLANGAVTLAKLNTSPLWTSSVLFTNPTPSDGDSFGSALAAVGPDRVIFGAQWENPGAYGAGAAYLYSTNGTLLTTITNPSPAEQDLFGYAVSSVGGDKLIIGAYVKDVAGVTNTGAAFLYNTNGTLLATFNNPTPATDDNFGWAVAGVGADKVVVAANNDSTGATNAGAAYVFNLNGTLSATILNPAPAVGDQFGYQLVAVGTDKILVSAVADDAGATNAGTVYLFSTNGTLLTTFTNPMPVQSVFFGLRIAAAGNDRVLISGALADFTTGVVYLYSLNGTLLATFGPAPLIGASMALMNPDKVVISAAGDGPGFVHLYSTNGTRLTTIANPNPVNGALFGYTLATFGDKLLIGVPQDSTGAPGAGVAHLFGIGAQYIPGLVGDAAFAPSPINNANDPIDSSRIVDGTIAEVDLADGAISDSKISSVDASKLTGTILDALLSPNVAFTFANQTFTGQNEFNNPANAFTGNGSALMALNASQLTSGTVADGRLTANVALRSANQTFSGANTFNNAGNNFTGGFTGGFTGNGAGLTNVAASTLGGLSSSVFWRTTGNAGTTPAANFLGTTDNQALTLRVNNLIALQVRPGASLPNIVGGLAAFRPSVIANGVSGAVIAGGNAPSGGVTGVGGGDFQAVYDDNGVIGGGFGNKVGNNNADVTDAAFATVAGGVFNSASGYAGTVGGGDGNYASGSRATVAGGYGNGATGAFSTVGGGLANVASGDFGTVVGGNANVAGINALAAGNRAKANHQGSFVWADSQAADFSSSANNEFSVRASGGVRLNADTSMFFGNQTRQMLNLWSTAYGIGIQSATVYFRTDTGGGFSWFRGGVHSDASNNPGAGGTEVMRLDSGGNLSVRGVFTPNVNLTSDRNAKENFEPINSREVLEKVAALPITRWNFKQDTASEHIGPMAQDFYASFGTGSDDKHIGSVDANGVALAAIQGLNEKLDGKTQKSEQRMSKLEEENAALKRELAELKKLVQAVTHR